MKRTCAAALSLLIMALLPALLLGKGHTDKITIQGAALTTPVEITDPKIGEFNVWAGPGVFVNGVEQHEGFIIDWSRDIVAKLPPGLQHYKVSFYLKLPDEQPAYQLLYVVSYDYDPSMSQGYIYLPGVGDKWFRANGGMWHGHGFEGNWSYATTAWESFVRPLIAKYRTAGLGP